MDKVGLWAHETNVGSCFLKETKSSNGMRSWNAYIVKVNEDSKNVNVLFRVKNIKINETSGTIPLCWAQRFKERQTFCFFE